MRLTPAEAKQFKEIVKDLCAAYGLDETSIVAHQLAHATLEHVNQEFPWAVIHYVSP